MATERIAEIASILHNYSKVDDGIEHVLSPRQRSWMIDLYWI